MYWVAVAFWQPFRASLLQKSREAAEKIIHANVRNAEGMTPLHVAAIRGFDEMTSLLLRRGAQTDVKNYTQRRAPLHFACQYNHPRVWSLRQKWCLISNAMLIVEVRQTIYLIPKWRPISYSFVCMLISPLQLVNMYKKKKEFWSENEAKRAD